MNTKAKTEEKGKDEADQAASPKAASGEAKKAPAWQAKDYTGPLDIEQANWRRLHLKD